MCIFFFHIQQFAVLLHSGRKRGAAQKSSMKSDRVWSQSQAVVGFDFFFFFSEHISLSVQLLSIYFHRPKQHSDISGNGKSPSGHMFHHGPVPVLKFLLGGSMLTRILSELSDSCQLFQVLLPFLSFIQLVSWWKKEYCILKSIIDLSQKKIKPKTLLTSS